MTTVAPSTERALLLACLCSTWPALLLEPQGTSMSDSVLLASMRLVDAGTWSLSDAPPEQVHGRVAFDIARGVNGRAYSGVGPGATVLAIPLYAALRPLLDALPELRDPRADRVYRRNARTAGEAPAPHLHRLRWLHVFACLFLVTPLVATCVFRAARIGTGLTDKAIVAATLGALPFYYWGMYCRGTLAAALLWHAWITLSGEGTGRRALLAAGAMLGAAITIDYPIALAVGGTLLLVAYRHSPRSALWCALPVLVAGATLAAYHNALFGGPFETPYAHRFWLGPSAEGIDLRRFERGAFVGLNPPSLIVAVQLVLGSAKGLLFHAPAVLLGVLGLLRAGETRSRFLLGLAVAYLVFNSMLGTHLPPDQAQIIWGGLPMHWGPRHLLAVAAPLALGVAAVRGEFIGVVIAASVAVNGAAAMYSHLLMEEPALSERLANPAALLLQWLWQQGPMIPLLEALVLPRAAQLTILIGAGLLTVIATVRLRRLNQSQKQTVL